MTRSATSSPIDRTAPGPLRLRRLTLGLTQADLARLAGVSREQVARLEAGECQPHLHTARSLAEALACDPDFIFPNDDAPAEDRGATDVTGAHPPT